MFSSLMNIGASGLAAAQASLATTSHNIANANVPGFSRQQAVLSTAGGQATGAGFIGQGVDISTVLRQYDQFLGQAVQGLGSVAGADRARADALAQLDDVFSDPATGVGAGIDALFGAIGDVANRPGDTAAREVMLSTLQQLAERFNRVGGQLAQLGAQADARLAYEAAQANDRLAELRQLNEQITRVAGSGQPPNDLLDRRDQALQALGTFLSIRTLPTENGGLSVFTAGGQPLLVGQQQSVLATQADPADRSRLALTLSVGGTTQQLDEADLAGGSLAGTLRFRDADLAAVQARLGQLATVLAGALNAQQALGVDASGQPGAALLSVPAPSVSPHSANSGGATLSVDVTAADALQPSDYRIDWDGSAYRITRLSDQRVTTAATMPQTVDGLELNLAGSAATGDSWLVRPFAQAATGLKALAVAPAGLATGYAALAQAAADNAGSVRVAGFEVVRAAPENTAAVRIRFNDPPTTFDVTGLAGGDVANVPYVPGQAIDYHGWRLVLAGQPAAGDSIDVQRNTAPGSDNRNALALGRIATLGLVQGGTLNEGYAGLIADAGGRVMTARSLADVSGRMQLEAQARKENVSGVNLDEEAANLLRHQQSYQACAKVIQASQSLFDALLAATGR